MWTGRASMAPPPTIDRIASRSRSSLCVKSLMVMRAMGTSLQRTIGDGHPEEEARDEATDRGRRELRPRGALRWRSSVASRPTDSLRTVARHPSIASRPQPPESSKRKLFHLFYQSLAETQHDSDHGWHGARIIDHRADAQTSIQLNILTHTF